MNFKLGTHLIIIILLIIETQLHQILVNQTNSTYTIPINYNNQNYHLKLDFNTSQNWIKSNLCHICINHKDNKCTQKCSQKIGSNNKGITCNKKFCKKVSKSSNADLQGQLMQLSYNLIDVKNEKLGKKSKFIAVSKFYESIKPDLKNYDGTINLFGKQYFFEEFTLLNDNNKLMIIVNESSDKYLLPDNKIALKIAGQITDLFKIKEINVQNYNETTQNFLNFSLDYQGILFPQTIYNKIQENIINILNANCTVQKQNLKCSKKLNINTLQTKLLKLSFSANNSITFMLSQFLSKCEQKTHTCKLLLNKSMNTNLIILGQLFFSQYAIQVDNKQKQFRIYRINNNINKKLLQAETVKPVTTNFLTIARKKNLIATKIQSSTKQSNNKSINQPVVTKPNAQKQNEITKQDPTTVLYLFGKVTLYFLFFACLLAILLNLYYYRKVIISYCCKKEIKYHNANIDQKQNPNVKQQQNLSKVTKDFWDNNHVQGI